jgi:hypothetical protein
VCNSKKKKKKKKTKERKKNIFVPSLLQTAVNSFLMVAKVKQGLSLSSLSGDRFLFLSHFCANKSPMNILHT